MSARKLYVGFAVCGFLLIGIWAISAALNRPETRHPLQVGKEAEKRARQVISQRKQLDETTWSTEVLAQEYETFFVDLWDQLRKSKDPAAILKSIPFQSLAFASLDDFRLLQPGIERSTLAGALQSIDPNQWRDLIEGLERQGVRLVQSEWHHARFQPKGEGGPHSVVSMTLHLEAEQRRWIVKGNLEVTWAEKTESKVPAVPLRIVVREATILRGTETVVFQPETGLEISADGFVSLYDLDRDGRLDIVHGPNSIWWNRGERGFKRSPIGVYQDQMMTCGALADFNGDGMVDLLCGSRNEPLRVFLGSQVDDYSEGIFLDKPILIDATEALKNPSALAVGDIDRDGDLDVWVAQYRYPYVQGQMPTPYYDAKDGYPSYLLINDGQGRFQDGTSGAGLEGKRRRRTYGCSFVDLNNDHQLDLLVTSDFSGIDIYQNDGKGHFRDVTNDWVDEWHNFGMAHTFSDFDLDGRLDFFVTGMSSTTARRLDSMNLGRDSFEEHQRMRTIMGFGNRMYLATDQAGRFVEPDFRQQTARTGWSWGSTSQDFDNDGDVDVYVANGHISGETARDYCTKFWCHDIYTGTSQPDTAMDLVFKTDSSLNGISWNGFEHNCLLLNLKGREFVEVGFLLGAAFEFDSRAVVGADFDSDGKVDLYVGQHRNDGHQTGYLLRNIGRSTGKWIGVRLYEEGRGISPLGAKVRVVTSQGDKVAQVVTGDSFNAQHGNQLHFGLGDAEVRSIEVLWTDGTRRSLSKPAVNQYHRIKP